MSTSARRPFLSTPVFAMAGRVGGMLVPFFIAHFFGASEQTDAFFLAFGLITVLLGIFQRIFEVFLMPYLAEQKQVSDRKPAAFTAHVLLVILPALAVFYAVLGWALPVILARVAGFGEETARLVARFYFEMMPFFIFGVMISAGNAVFFIFKRYWYPAASPLIRSVWVLLALFLLKNSVGLHAVSWGFAAGEIIRWAVSFFLLFYLGIWHFRDDGPEVKIDRKAFWGQAGYQLLALLAINLTPLMNQIFASRIGEGNLSLFSYADRLFNIPFTIFTTGLLQIILSDWSDNFQQKDRPSFWRGTARDMRVALWIGIGISAAAWLLRTPVTRLFYGYGGLSTESLGAVANLFGWLMAGFAPVILSNLYARILFVYRRSGFYCFLSWVRLSVNALLNFLFIAWFGIIGIAIAQSLVFVLICPWMHYHIKTNLTREENPA